MTKAEKYEQEIRNANMGYFDTEHKGYRVLVGRGQLYETSHRWMDMRGHEKVAVAAFGASIYDKDTNQKLATLSAKTPAEAVASAKRFIDCGRADAEKEVPF